MIRLLEQLFAALWNRLRGRRAQARFERGSLDLGFRAVDGEVTRRHVGVSNTRRTTHIAAVGKTGVGKSSWMRYLSHQDIEHDRGFLKFDLHGEETPDLLRTVNARERREHSHLDYKLILIEPADGLVSVGVNPLERDESPDFVRNAELADVLTQRWGLDRFGARTDELLRNSLYVLSANGLTLVELAPLLSNATFRTACLKNVDNADVRDYFEQRYDRQSEAMQATLREPVLNKTSTFTADPHFRHIVGQAHSSFSLVEAMDQGYWVIVNLDKGRLGPQALTLGSLIFTMVKNALFRRQKRALFFLRHRQFMSAEHDATVLRLSRKLVAGKIRNQRTLLQRNHIEPPEQTLRLLKALADKAEAATELESLLGIEGSAARIYFSEFAGMLKAEEGEDDAHQGQRSEFRFDFTDRNRRPPKDPVNAFLSLAYSILTKDLTITSYAMGFDPYWGFYHQPRFGRPALALDLMEPFRPLIADSAVLTAINTRMVTPTDFIKSGSSVALKPNGRKGFFRAYELRMDALVTHPMFDYRVSYRRVLEIQARLLARFLNGEIDGYPVFVTR